MKILIVEDDENKRNKITLCLKELLPALSVMLARSLNSGIAAIFDKRPDIVLLDMSMPTFDITVDDDGGRPQAYAGREILRQMDRHDMTTPVIVITQFDRFGQGADTLTLEELDQQLREAHPESYRGVVYYDTAVEGWKSALSEKVQKIANTDQRF